MNWWTKLLAQRGLYEEATDGTEGGAAGGPVQEPEGKTPEQEELDDDATFLESLFKEDEPEPEELEPEVVEEPEKKEEEPPKEEPEVKEEPEPEKKEEPEKEPEKEPEPEQPSEEEAAERHKQFLAEVEKSFAISEEDANLIVTEPEKVLPRLAANVYDRAMRDTAEMIRQFSENLPNMLSNYSQQQTAAQKNQEDFLKANPGIEAINEAELLGLVNQFAPMIAKQNISSREEQLKALGRTIAAFKGIQLGVPQEQTPPPVKEEPVVPHSPAAPVRSGVQPAPAPASEADAFIDMLLNSDD